MLIERVRENKQIPTRISSDTFTDGTEMGHFWHSTCKRIGWRNKHPDVYQLMLTCDSLLADYEQWETDPVIWKLQELIDRIEHNNNQIPTRISTDTFTDGTKMGHFWHAACRKGGWREIYPGAYQLMQTCEPLSKNYERSERRRKSKQK